jgi:hypothetical protein
MFCELAATPKPTVPLPLPFEPEITTTQFTTLSAVQVQPAPVDTANVPDPPFTVTVVCGGVNV